METYLLYILHMFWVVLSYMLYILVIRVRFLQRGGDFIEMRQKSNHFKLFKTYKFSHVLNLYRLAI